MKCGQDKKERAPLWPSPGHRELDGLGVPGVLWVLPGQVSGHAVGGHVPPYLCLVLADPVVCPGRRYPHSIDLD